MAIVKIELADDMQIDSLVKTTESGDAFEFTTTKIQYNDDLGDFNDWISQLEYNIYDYSKSSGQPEVVLQLAQTNDTIKRGWFWNRCIKYTYGSAYGELIMTVK